MSFSVFMPTKWILGAGALHELGKQPLPGKKALLVISNGKSTKENGYLSRVIEQLARQKAEPVIFDKVEANPLHTTIMKSAEYAKENGCDFIVRRNGNH